jgi:hypothetical protein
MQFQGVSGRFSPEVARMLIESVGFYVQTKGNRLSRFAGLEALQTLERTYQRQKTHHPHALAAWILFIVRRDSLKLRKMVIQSFHLSFLGFILSPGVCLFYAILFFRSVSLIHFNSSSSVQCFYNFLLLTSTFN